VHAEDLVIDKGSDWHTIENILKLFPQSDAVPIFAFVIKSINSVNLTTFMITTKEEKVFLEFYFVG
jgi:hypothetical protein